MECKVPKNLGAILLEARPYGDGESVILCFMPEQAERYATWRYSEEGGCYWGHYTNSLENALEDFKTR